MNKIETKALLDKIAAVDNRKLTPEAVEAWHDVIGFMPYDIALAALALARKDDRIQWLEPKNIVSWAREAAFQLDRQEQKPEPQPYKFAPQPTCRAHNKKILSCDPCCHEMSKQRHLTDAQLLVWAKQNIYA